MYHAHDFYAVGEDAIDHDIIRVCDDLARPWNTARPEQVGMISERQDTGFDPLS